MVLTPMEIHNKTFEKKFKGYDEEEVDKFLDQIVNEYGDILDENSDLKNENNSLKKERETLKNKVDEYDQIKESLNQSLISAQQHADNLQKQANREAKEIKEKAQKEADEILSKAKLSAGKYNADVREQYGTLSSDYELLKKQVAEFRKEIQIKLQDELDGLSDNAWQQQLDEYYGRSRLYPADGSQPVSIDDDDDGIMELSEDEIAAEDAAVAAEEAEKNKQEIDKPTSNEVKSVSGLDDSDGPKILIGDSSNNATASVSRDKKASRLRSSDNNGPTIIFPDDDSDNDN